MAQKTTLTLTGIYGPVLSFTAKTAAPATVYPWRQAGNLPLALLVSASPGGQLLYDWSLDARGVVMSDGERGHESLTWAVEMDVEQAYRVHDALKTPFVVMSCGFVAWEGRLEDKRVTPTGLELTAMGSWRAMSDYGPYNALWSDSSTARWEEGSTEQLSTYAAERFKTDSNNRLFLAPAAGEIFPAGLNIGARYYKIPHRSGRNLTVVQFAYEIKLGLYWTARLRSFDSAWGSAATVWSLAGALNGPVQSGAVYAAVSSGAILAFELVCSYPTTTTLGTAIAEVNTTLAPSSLRVNTTSGTAVAAPGTVTITPAAMTNIVNGMKLLYGAGTVNLEKVEVSNVTGTTFDATFKNTHPLSAAIKSTDDWAVPEVDTATTGGHAAGSVTITPDSMANIVDGMSLLIGYGGEAEETVVVSSVTATTFDCTLVYGHPSGDKIRNAANSYTVRPQSMTGIAVGMRLDIGGRGKETVIVTAITATTFTAIFENSHPGDAPVTRATLQTVTPSSMTGITVGRSYQIGNEAAATDSQIEDIVVISVTGSTFTAEFKAPHGSTDSVQRIYRPESVTGGYMEITSLRVATTTANAVSTTIGSNITAGTRTVTPASMANIYEGQKLVIDGSGVGDLGEIVTVTAITSTTFTADFALSHTTAITVKGIVVYGSEIVAAITTLAAALNPAQLFDSLAGIEATSRDLEIERYEDVPAVDVLGYLADEGDDDRYEVGVWDAQRVHFRERGSQARTWYTDVVELELDSTLDTLTNQVHGTYRSAGGETLRTATADNSQSQTRYGIIRRGFVTASTTSDKQATAVRDSYLVARNIITPRIGIVTEGLFDGAGIQHPLWMLRTGDVLELRNLPVTLSETVDKVRRFRVKKKTYDVDRDILKPVPELELPGLDIFMTTPMLKAAKQAAKADWSRAINPAADWTR